MLEECKDLEKIAKEIEKENWLRAIEKYKEAATCYNNYAKLNERNNCHAKAANLLRNLAKTKENVDKAFNLYEQSSEVYKQAEKTSDAEKVMKEAHQRFVEYSKQLGAEATKTDDVDLAEKKFVEASEYALKGKDEELSNSCWIGSAKKFRKKATEIENPREALEVSKHAVANYQKGSDNEAENDVWSEAAEKFYKKALEIEKTKKSLVLAIDCYIQASTLYTDANLIEKTLDINMRIDELCEIIGLPLTYITNYLANQDLQPVSV
jgi:tetratricopeptide (TPR) repeat protein